MSKKNVIFIFGIALFFALSVTVLTTGCSTTSSQMTTGSAQKMDADKAQNMMKVYMDTESAAGYLLKNFRDDGTHYRADVVNSEGSLMNGIAVNKETGRVYFTKK